MDSLLGAAGNGALNARTQSALASWFGLPGTRNRRGASGATTTSTATPPASSSQALLDPGNGPSTSTAAAAGPSSIADVFRLGLPQADNAETRGQSELTGLDDGSSSSDDEYNRETAEFFAQYSRGTISWRVKASLALPSNATMYTHHVHIHNQMCTCTYRSLPVSAVRWQLRSGRLRYLMGRPAYRTRRGRLRSRWVRSCTYCSRCRGWGQPTNFLCRRRGHCSGWREPEPTG